MWALVDEYQNGILRNGSYFGNKIDFNELSDQSSLRTWHSQFITILFLFI
ncbi:hypothetical protein VCRA2121O157_410006 [Vibrio crassostreae]|uniref:Uncharacterized protein n=1 Tax=Vibrio crassostreae TaxID=246167 RepID=A0A822MWK1_9VIBR|nr:hypothetical protein VCRA2112O187_11030001 [Vibrio crassostreae]CAK1893928.1 hypothetical protein VCRA2110O135_220001 [Vibrio crassostreae]CAK2020810.1 hypothetical protein VCRA2118O236_330001 [Vibrio crassostreae]CAK2046817.1 hypothetical protein VCRA2116O234_360001 [Vibrio crassostreae]CAK2048335.1 hypothetical protein VCRA2113O202_330001 [Vibrio crassostreae]